MTGLRFNPIEYALATCSADRVLRAWDIDTQECISQSLPLEQETERMLFTECGTHLIAGSATQLHSFRWEPFEQVHQTAVQRPSALLHPMADVANNSNSKQPALLDLSLHADSLLQLVFEQPTRTLKLLSNPLDVS